MEGRGREERGGARGEGRGRGGGGGGKRGVKEEGGREVVIEEMLSENDGRKNKNEKMMS